MKWVILDEFKEHNGTTESFEYAVSQLEEGEYITTESQFWDLEVGNCAYCLQKVNGKLVDAVIYDDEVCDALDQMPDAWTDNHTRKEWVRYYRRFIA